MCLFNILNKQTLNRFKPLAKRPQMLIIMKRDYQFFYRKFNNWHDAINFVCGTMSMALEHELGRLSDSYIRHFGMPGENEDNATVQILKASIRMKQLFGYDIKLVRI